MNEAIEKYNINKSHAEWHPLIDNWYSVEVILLVSGELPNGSQDEKQCFMDFLDNKDGVHQKAQEKHGMLKFGSCYLTSKRALFRILSEGKDADEFFKSLIL